MRFSFYIYIWFKIKQKWFSSFHYKRNKVLKTWNIDEFSLLFLCFYTFLLIFTFVFVNWSVYENIFMKFFSFRWTKWTENGAQESFFRIYFWGQTGMYLISTLSSLKYCSNFINNELGYKAYKIWQNFLILSLQ